MTMNLYSADLISHFVRGFVMGALFRFVVETQRDYENSNWWMVA